MQCYSKASRRPHRWFVWGCDVILFVKVNCTHDGRFVALGGGLTATKNKGVIVTAPKEFHFNCRGLGEGVTCYLWWVVLVVIVAIHQFACNLHGAERSLALTPPAITPLMVQARFSAILGVRILRQSEIITWETILKDEIGVNCDLVGFNSWIKAQFCQHL